MHDQYSLMVTSWQVRVSHNTLNVNVSRPLFLISAMSISPSYFCFREYQESDGMGNCKTITLQVLSGWRMAVRFSVGPKLTASAHPCLLSQTPNLSLFTQFPRSEHLLASSFSEYFESIAVEFCDTVLYCKGSCSQRPRTKGKLSIVRNVLETSPAPSNQLCPDNLSGPLHHTFPPSLQSKEVLYIFFQPSLLWRSFSPSYQSMHL